MVEVKLWTVNMYKTEDRIFENVMKVMESNIFSIHCISLRLF